MNIKTGIIHLLTVNTLNVYTHKKTNSNFDRYVYNKAPLRQYPLIEFPLGAIKPESVIIIKY